MFAVPFLGSLPFPWSQAMSVSGGVIVLAHETTYDQDFVRPITLLHKKRVILERFGKPRFQSFSAVVFLISVF